MPRKSIEGGDASIALVGVHSEFPKYTEEKDGSVPGGVSVGQMGSIGGGAGGLGLGGKDKMGYR